MVGLVRWGRNHPRIKENLSGGVGMVCGMECGIFERSRLFSVRVHVGPPDSVGPAYQRDVAAVPGRERTLASPRPIFERC